MARETLWPRYPTIIIFSNWSVESWQSYVIACVHGEERGLIWWWGGSSFESIVCEGLVTLWRETEVGCVSEFAVETSIAAFEVGVGFLTPLQWA